MADRLQDRIFPRAGEFEAYRDCERWLYELGCSIGSMQRSAPIGVIFEPGHYISKNRNLGPDAKDMHGWITFPGGGSPRNGDVRFTITKLGHEFLAAAAIDTSGHEMPERANG